MTSNQRNPLVRLLHAPRRIGDEMTRRRQRIEAQYVERGYLRKYLDRIGSLRDKRLVEVNQIRFEKRLPHLLASAPGPLSEDHWSARRINTLASRFPKWHDYLEIGIFEGLTFANVKIRHRVGVDPAPLFDLRYPPRGCEVEVLTSDAYFAKIAPSVRFDVAFVDGLHTAEQTYRDVVNVFAHLNHGPVLIDDTVPLDEISAIADQAESYRARAAAGLEGRQWHGDVWRVVLLLERHHPELDWRTITDRGNPQTLVWRRQAGSMVNPATQEQRAVVMALEYTDVFANGTPAAFRPSLEDDALATCAAALRAR